MFGDIIRFKDIRLWWWAKKCDWGGFRISKLWPFFNSEL